MGSRKNQLKMRVLKRKFRMSTLEEENHDFMLSGFAYQAHYYIHYGSNAEVALHARIQRGETGSPDHKNHKKHRVS